MKRRTLVALTLAFAASAALAQRPVGGSRFDGMQGAADGEFEKLNVPYDGRVAFVRLRFTPARTGYGGGGGFFGGINYQWDHDYPRADRHFTTIMAELTTIGMSSGHQLVAIGSPELFHYPIGYMSEPGWWTMTDAEALNLRNYLLKGGFLIFDDFAGGGPLQNLQTQIRRILPDARLMPLDLSHPVFHTFFEIPSLNFMHPYYNVPSEFYGVFEDNDPRGRLIAVANYNNDIGESWEFSDTGLFPVDQTNTAYKLGVNYYMYALTR